MNKMCGGQLPPACFPGCPPPSGGRAPWCTSAELRGATCAWSGDFGPSDGENKLEQCLRQQVKYRGTDGIASAYNELVIDPREIIAQLPSSIEGAFYSAAADHTQMMDAVNAHARFVTAFALEADTFPLLVYDPSAPTGTPVFTPAPPPPPLCSSPLADDTIFEKCEEWCSDTDHCRYCKCRLCAPLCTRQLGHSGAKHKHGEDARAAPDG
jgi:hypothetical protein